VIELLKTTGLRAGYSAGDVLRGVDIDVARGEIVAVLGRNGVGKTTLMKSLIGILPLRGGQIVFKGEDLTGEKADRRARRGIGYVPQGREVFPHMSVADNLRMGRFIRNSSVRDEVLLGEVYGYFPFLEQRMKQRAGTLSGGEQEMLSIGRVLNGDPVLLLLDEPSDGVQPSIVQDIGEFLLKLVSRRAISVLLVEQNIDLIQTVAGRAYVMDKGSVVASIGKETIKDTNALSRHLSI
jgi:ABC-type branched-subunit amino acid transport system ATPase component